LVSRLKNFVSFYEKSKNRDPFKVFFRGIEREGLRVSSNGILSQRPHPSILGSALTHPNVTTDFSESLLELVTPKFKTLEDCSQFLKDTHHFVYKNIKDEFIWCGSMPCLVEGEDSIPVAYYGESNIGKMKRIYRLGLKNRYGSLMEIIAGVHYNFSFSNDFWHFFKEYNLFLGEKPEECQKNFISSSYFCLIRNVHRFGWMIPLFFGASPALCGSFLRHFKEIPSFLKPFDKKGTYFSPLSTSLRLSKIGYKNLNQDQLKISYNDIASYVEGLQRAVQTSYGPWENIGIKDKDGNYKQLNTNLLQIENEYYGSIRPKRIVPSGSSPSIGLKKEGVEYIELRSLDINPFSPVGISEDQMKFLDIFLVYCLIIESPQHSPAGNRICEENFSKVVLGGQDRNLFLSLDEHTKQPISQILNNIFSEMNIVAELLDRSYSSSRSYQDVLKSLKKVIDGEDLSLSERVLHEMVSKKMSYFELIMDASIKNKSFFLERDLSREKSLYFMNESEKSKIEHLKIERGDNLPYVDFVKKYLNQRS
jgi:glutamate--cysteine ligase